MNLVKQNFLYVNYADSDCWYWDSLEEDSSEETSRCLHWEGRFLKNMMHTSTFIFSCIFHIYKEFQKAISGNLNNLYTCNQRCIREKKNQRTYSLSRGYTLKTEAISWSIYIVTLLRNREYTMFLKKSRIYTMFTLHCISVCNTGSKDI